MNALKIIIDGRMINESGIGRYIRNLIAHLKILDKKNNYYILHLKNDYDTLAYHNNFRKVLADFGWYGINEQIQLPGLVKSLKPDLIHFPHFNVPLLFNGKFVVTIHDLIHQHFQMKKATTLNPLFYGVKQLGYKKIFKNALEKSAKILVPSYYVKVLLVNEWDVAGNKVAVTYEAVDEKILEKCPMTNFKCQILLKKLSGRQPYIFYVGNAHPHKNVEGLIRVFEKLREKYPSLRLVLSGNDHYFWQKIKKGYQKEGIIYTGYVSDEELVSLYKNAAAFVMPSLEEGFGIPILEAMACSCPVVSSSAGSLPEVGGEAAFYFDPLDASDMVEKIFQVLDSEKLRKNLIEKGLKRYKQFSWKDLAKKTLEVYLSCV